MNVDITEILSRAANPTANELEKEAEKLAPLVASGNATMAQAERLAEVRRMLRRYKTIKFGRAW